MQALPEDAHYLHLERKIEQERENAETHSICVKAKDGVIIILST
jgi:hypothetical protein